MLTAQLGRRDVCEWLVSKNCDPNDADDGGRTAIDFAALSKHPELAEWLRAAGQKGASHSGASHSGALWEHVLSNRPKGDRLGVCS